LQDRPGGADLFVLNPDGADTRLTDAEANVYVDDGSFSPDGSQVGYATTYEDESRTDSSVWVINADGGKQSLIRSAGHRWVRTEGCPGNEGCVDGRRFVHTWLYAPTWSPDGSQIAYFDGMGDWGHRLRVMDSDGTDSRVVVENSETLVAGHVEGLEWSPDGSELAFSIAERLYVVGVDGSGFRLVTDQAVEPYWSADGSHIAYTRPDPQAERGSLEIVSLDDLQIQNFGDGESGPWSAELQWSADRRYR
jgi:Tol biopolymer transport system component